MNMADACQRHDPGDYPATNPYMFAEVRGSIRAEYRCSVCGERWSCWWHPETVGWPVRA